MKTNTLHNSPRTLKVLGEGVRDGIPIGLGYLAVSFSLGITAKNAGLTPLQGFIASLLCNASAGEYAGFTSIAANAAYLELAAVMLIANARYLLMSCALSQRMAPGTALIHRLIIGFDVTDEIFGVTIARPGYVNPAYVYGVMLMALPGWSVGTALGTMAGNILPARIVSALGVALYGMFLAVIIPPSKENRFVAVIVAVCFAASLAAAELPAVSSLSEGTRTIILTVVIASAAALIRPVTQEAEDSDEA